MYKAMAQKIIDNTNNGYALLPTEGVFTSMNKVSFKNFLAIDYRYSNNVLVSEDKESIVAPYEANQTHDSNYLMGFAIFRNVRAIKELDLLSTASKTRLSKKLIETFASVVADVRVPQNRGRRSVFIETERKDAWENSQDLLKFAVNSSVNVDDYMVLPFFVSTTVFFNNFRAKTGVGNTDTGVDLLKNDVMRRLPEVFSDLDEKVNKRLPSPLSSSLFTGVYFVDAKSITDDTLFDKEILDYANVFIKKSANSIAAPTQTPAIVNSVLPNVQPQALIGQAQKATPVPNGAGLPKSKQLKSVSDDDFEIDPNTGVIVWK